MNVQLFTFEQKQRFKNFCDEYNQVTFSVFTYVFARLVYKKNRASISILSVKNLNK